MATFQPGYKTRSHRTLVVSRGNAFDYTYRLPRTKRFPEYTNHAVLEFHNTYGQLLDVFFGSVSENEIRFLEDPSRTDLLERTTSWRLIVEIEGYPRVLEQGIVVRDEAPWPDMPPTSNRFDGVRYQYSFDTPGRLVDPSWHVLHGRPTVWDNSSRDLPNAVAAGGGWAEDVAIRWFAPLTSDPVRMTYNTIRPRNNANGHMWVVICSNSDMSNWAGFHHKQVWGIGSWDDDEISVVTGSGPTTFTARESDEYDTETNQSYTAEFNPVSNTYSLYIGEDTEPLISWTDSTHIVNHGPGERYVGLGFRSEGLDEGVQCSDWYIADTP